MENCIDVTLLLNRSRDIRDKLRTAHVLLSSVNYSGMFFPIQAESYPVARSRVIAGTTNAEPLDA